MRASRWNLSKENAEAISGQVYYAVVIIILFVSRAVEDFPATRTEMRDHCMPLDESSFDQSVQGVEANTRWDAACAANLVDRRGFSADAGKNV